MIILANIAGKSQSTSFLEMAFQLIFLIFVFVVIIFLAYYSTKFIAGAKIKTMTKSNMKVIETISIGLHHIHIIKGIRMLSEISGEDLIITDNNNELPFEKQLKQYINNMKSKDKKGGKYEK